MSVKITVNSNRCKGCGLCEATCPLRIVEMDLKMVNKGGYHPAIVREPEKCSGCASCAIICPDGAIRIEK